MNFVKSLLSELLWCNFDTDTEVAKWLAVKLHSVTSLTGVS